MSFDTLKLDKGLYTSNKSFTNALEEIDPSENYIGTQYEGLDAYQRQLKRFGIKVNGRNSDTVAKFFETSDSAVLFPEFVARAVRMGVDEVNYVDEIVATTTVVDSLDYRSIQALDYEPAGDFEENILEGAYIPETIIKTNDKLTQLKKFGRSIVASYEAVKTQKLDVFAIALKQIGRYINSCELKEIIPLFDSADSQYIEPVESGELCYQDIINLWNKLRPYNMNVILAEADATAKLLTLDEFKDSQAGQNFHGTGNMITPLGAKLITLPTEVLSGAIIGLDKNYAVEKVQLGDITTDFDKLIDRQLEKATVTSIVGFNKIVDSASALCG